MCCSTRPPLCHPYVYGAHKRHSCAALSAAQACRLLTSAGRRAAACALGRTTALNTAPSPTATRRGNPFSHGLAPHMSLAGHMQHKPSRGKAERLGLRLRRGCPAALLWGRRGYAPTSLTLVGSGTRLDRAYDWRLPQPALSHWGGSCSRGHGLDALAPTTTS